jgi:hypothetical protein
MVAAGPFTQAELRQAREVGLGRRALAVRRERTQPSGDPGSRALLFDCYGALAELAVARYLELPWNSALVGDLHPKPPDVGGRVEVKWVQPRGRHLIGHERDPDDWVMVMCRGWDDTLEIVGWTVAPSVKRPRWRGNPLARNSNDYWLPERELLLPELLLEMRPWLA